MQPCGGKRNFKKTTGLLEAKECGFTNVIQNSGILALKKQKAAG